MACASNSESQTASHASTPVIWNIESIDAKAELIQSGQRIEFYERMKIEADSVLKTANPTVTSKPNAAATGTMNDYVSLARYWWPDPNTPDGLPYVRHDGKSNPELRKYDRDRLGDFCSAIKTLSLVYYVSGEQKYADGAVSKLRTWFIDPETRMNPNFKFSQIRRGHDNDQGTPFGLLDGYSFVEMLDALVLLESKGAVPSSVSDSIQTWFAELSEWMLTSENGIAEANEANNHAVAYDAQVIRYAMYGGRDSIARRVVNEFSERRLDTQIAEDGRMPHELARTNAFGYTSFNLIHMMDICDMARVLGIDLYPASNRAIERAIDWMMPYSIDPESFPYEQIGGWRHPMQDFTHVVYRASRYGKSEEYQAYYKQNKSHRESANFEFLYIN